MESAMKYLCLGYYDEKKFNSLPRNELHTLVNQCQPHDQALHNSGQLDMVASLAAPHSSASLRPKNGEPSITDGPYAETKEQVGAFFIIDARDLNDAIRVASKHPAAHLGEEVGWGVEVRPIETLDQA
jgi:hypothetical protein